MRPEMVRAATTRLEEALRAKLGGGGRAFVPYVTAGLAGVDADLLRALEGAGADAVEVGIPFSDPVIDGGVIQEASGRALEGGFHPRDVFALVEDAGLGIPVVVMTYLNPVLAMRLDGFLDRASDAGVAGVIVPDLPVDEADEWSRLSSAAAVATIFLAAPGTSQERMSRVAESSTGFVYCVATYGVTGERTQLSGTSREVVEKLRPVTDRPLLVGVGIGTPEQASDACEFADGVIVGSALVRPILEGRPERSVELAAEFREAIPAD
ncbi:MAG: tryptophan synthase subunit alpha [Actinomycetota bacterium]